MTHSQVRENSEVFRVKCHGWPNPESPKTVTGRVREAQSKAAIPVAWTFMSEILVSPRRNIQRLPKHNSFRFDRVSWLCDGQECLQTIIPPANPKPDSSATCFGKAAERYSSYEKNS